jgi:hypothetical protein
MQQRRLRLGDIVDDYCPRERRITNHAIVAMIEDEVKQTRCSTCDADHEYKQARVPAQRKRKEGAPALSADVPAGTPRKRAATRDVAIQNGTQDGAMHDVSAPDAAMQADAAAPVHPVEAAPAREDVLQDQSPAANAAATPQADTTADAPVAAAPEPAVEDEGPVHRPLIRATLPRPEGQVPERKMPDFTVRQPGARGFDNNNNGNAQRHARPGHRRPARPGVRPQGGNPSGQSTRFGQRHGNAPRQPSGRPTQTGQRHGRPAGENRGGRKRGR